jgi:uracil-DNA glycosylase
VRCAPPANHPNPDERDNCLPFLGRELALLPNLRTIVCLGAFAYDGVSRLMQLRSGPRVGHGAELQTESGVLVLCSFHPSQQNTFTGRLTEPMLDSIFGRARDNGARSLA